MACAAALCLLAAACGGGGGGGEGPGGSGLTPFPTVTTDELPPGTRIDVSAKNLFQMGMGDSWQFSTLDAGGNPTGATATRQVVSDNGAGHISLFDFDGGGVTIDHVVSADGLCPAALGAACLDRGEHPRRHPRVRDPALPAGRRAQARAQRPLGPGPDGDGIGESFRFEFSQVFLG
jgi:hypothetical protein